MKITHELAVQTLRDLVEKQKTWTGEFGGYSEMVEKVLIYAADELEILMLREDKRSE